MDGQRWKMVYNHYSWRKRNHQNEQDSMNYNSSLIKWWRDGYFSSDIFLAVWIRGHGTNSISDVLPIIRSVTYCLSCTYLYS